MYAALLLLSFFGVPTAASAPGPIVQFFGTEGDDLLEGTADRNVIRGRGGDDVLNGFESDDELFGDCGSDVYEFGRVIDRDRVSDSSSCVDDSGRSRRDRNIVDFTWYYSYEVRPKLRGDDLVLVVQGGHRVRFVDFANDPFIERFYFNDGRSWSLGEVLERVGLEAPDAGALEGLAVDVFRTRGSRPSGDCAQGFAFAEGKVRYECDALFLAPFVVLTADAPTADWLEVRYTLCDSDRRGSCNDPDRLFDVVETIDSGEPFRVDGYVTTFGEENIHNVNATLTVSRAGRRQSFAIDLQSAQFR